MEPIYAIGRFTTAAIRSAAKPRAELLSQLLLGEPVKVLSTSGRYALIQCADDNFEGYVRRDQLLNVSETTYRLQRDNPAFVLDLYAAIQSDHFHLPVTFGARLPAFDGMRLNHAKTNFHYTGQAALSEDLHQNADLMIRLARRWMYTPELTGGRTPTGIDAIAWVQLVARLLNIRLPRTAEAMSDHGRLVDFVIQCQAGDLAFFDNRRGHIEHVGILLPDSRVMHVDECVRIDAIDHYGIFNYDLGKYTHRLRIVKRLLPDTAAPNVLVDKKTRVREFDQNQLQIFTA